MIKGEILLTPQYVDDGDKIYSHNHNYVFVQGTKEVDICKITIEIDDIAIPENTFIANESANIDDQIIYNMYSYTKTLFDYFDNFNYDDSLTTVNPPELVKPIKITFQMVYEDETTDDFIKTFKVYRGGTNREENNIFNELILGNKVTVFKGYPICATNYFSLDFLNRSTISDGQNITAIGSLEYDIKDINCESIYLKWFNRDVGYSYWLFEKNYQEDYKGKSLGRLAEIYSWSENTLNIGNESTRTQVVGGKFDIEKYDFFTRLIDSNEIYLFTGNKDEVYTVNKWLEVSLKSPSIKKNTKNGVLDLRLTIELPERNTDKRI